MERSSYMLPIMVGCSYNQCKFCNLFRHLKFRELPMDEIKAEIKRVKDMGGNPRKIFLGDGNAFGTKMDRLVEILNLIHENFPDVVEINMDATITNVRAKSDEQLKMLYDLGVRHLYIGIESGLDDVLKFMKKDHGIEAGYEQIERLQKAGLIYDAHIMTGVAGKGRGEENAIALAEFINKTHPAHICNFSMFLHKEVPLYADVEAGRFVPASEYDNLVEEKILLEHIEADEEHPIKYEGFHDFIEVRVNGKLPKDKEKMVKKLEMLIPKFEDKKNTFSYVYGECPNVQKCEGDLAVWNMKDEL